jgi:hypothetical protein
MKCTACGRWRLLEKAHICGGEWKHSLPEEINVVTICGECHRTGSYAHHHLGTWKGVIAEYPHMKAIVERAEEERRVRRQVSRSALMDGIRRRA